MKLSKQNCSNTYAVSIYAHELQVQISATELSRFSQRKFNVRSKISHVLLDNDVFHCLAVAIANLRNFFCRVGRARFTLYGRAFEPSEFAVSIHGIRRDTTLYMDILSPFSGVVLWCNG
jgi:hypothetical protein